MKRAIFSLLSFASALFLIGCASDGSRGTGTEPVQGYTAPEMSRLDATEAMQRQHAETIQSMIPY